MNDPSHNSSPTGRTLVLATHDEDFAGTWATRVLRVREGIVSESTRSPAQPPAR